MKRQMICLSLWMLIFCFSQAQLTDGFNYQAIARDVNGSVLSNRQVNIRFQIRRGTPAGMNAFTETHAPQTNEFGLLNLVIGGGTLESGNFSAINWSTDKHFLIVELNGLKLDTVQFQAVPYSKLATDMHLSDLKDVSGAASVGQVLEWNGTNWTPANGADGDSDPTNEIQSLSKSANLVSLSLGGGSFIDETEDDDSDPVNEIQVLSKFGNTVSLSNGGGNFVDEVDDADSDPGNELQSLSKMGDSLLLSNGGGSIFLNTYWRESRGDVYYNQGNVGIGTSFPDHALHLSNGNFLIGTFPSLGGDHLFFDESLGALSGGSTGEPDSMGEASFSWGTSSRAIGDYSFAIGRNTRSQTYTQITLGQNNVASNGSATSWVFDDPLFVIGNGYLSNRNNAITLTKRGFLGLNTASPSHLFHLENADLSNRSIFINHDKSGLSTSPEFGLYIDLDKTSVNSTTNAFGAYSLVLCEGGAAYGTYGYAKHSSFNSGLGAYGVRAISENDGGTGVSYAVFASLAPSSSSGAEYAGYFNGDVFSTGAFIPSDEQLKRKIKDADPALEKIMQLRLLSYEYKSESYPHMRFPKGQRMGFIAQNVQKVMPELVKKATMPSTSEEEVKLGMPAGEEIDFLAVDYSSMIPYLVKALQEQQAEIEQLKEELNALKNK